MKTLLGNVVFSLVVWCTVVGALLNRPATPQNYDETDFAGGCPYPKWNDFELDEAIGDVMSVVPESMLLSGLAGLNYDKFDMCESRCAKLEFVTGLPKPNEQHFEFLTGEWLSHERVAGADGLPTSPFERFYGSGSVAIRLRPVFDKFYPLTVQLVVGYPESGTENDPSKLRFWESPPVPIRRGEWRTYSFAGPPVSLANWRPSRTGCTVNLGARSIFGFCTASATECSEYDGTLYTQGTAGCELAAASNADIKCCSGQMPYDVYPFATAADEPDTRVPAATVIQRAGASGRVFLGFKMSSLNRFQDKAVAEEILIDDMALCNEDKCGWTCDGAKGQACDTPTGDCGECLNEEPWFAGPSGSGCYHVEGQPFGDPPQCIECPTRFQTQSEWLTALFGEPKPSLTCQLFSMAYPDQCQLGSSGTGLSGIGQFGSGFSSSSSFGSTDLFGSGSSSGGSSFGLGGSSGSGLQFGSLGGLSGSTSTFGNFGGLGGVQGSRLGSDCWSHVCACAPGYRTLLNTLGAVPLCVENLCLPFCEGPHSLCMAANSLIGGQQSYKCACKPGYDEGSQTTQTGANCLPDDSACGGCDRNKHLVCNSLTGLCQCDTENNYVLARDGESCEKLCDEECDGTVGLVCRQPKTVAGDAKCGCEDNHVFDAVKQECVVGCDSSCESDGRHRCTNLGECLCKEPYVPAVTGDHSQCKLAGETNFGDGSTGRTGQLGGGDACQNRCSALRETCDAASGMCQCKPEFPDRVRGQCKLPCEKCDGPKFMECVEGQCQCPENWVSDVLSVNGDCIPDPEYLANGPQTNLDGNGPAWQQNLPLYIGAGAGGLVFLIILCVCMPLAYWWFAMRPRRRRRKELDYHGGRPLSSARRSRSGTSERHRRRSVDFYNNTASSNMSLASSTPAQRYATSPHSTTPFASKPAF